MSYILDALRRADSERERGAVPDVYAQQVPVATSELEAVPARLPAWAWVGAVLVAGLMCAVVWLLSTRDAPRDAAAIPGHAVMPSTSNPPTAVALSPPAPITPITPTTPVAAAGVAPAAAPAAAPAVAPAVPPLVRPSPVLAAPPPRAAPKTTTAKAEPAVAAPSKASAPEVRFYTVAELPEEVRRDLPALTIGGAMYSENAANRMLIINGQLFHERDKLGPGLVLVQIRLKSAVLEFRGYRYGISY